MKLQPKEYKTVSSRLYVEAASGKKPPVAALETEETLLKESRTLFKARTRPASARKQKLKRTAAIGTVGVTSLDGLKELMERFEKQHELLKFTGHKNRQALHEAVKGASEILSRARTDDGVPVSRHTQNLINAINRHDDPTICLVRFVLHLVPIQHRPIVARLLSIYLQIPLDDLIKSPDA